MFQTLIGNSLGKLHIPTQLDEDVFKAIQQHINTDDAALLNDWYRLNETTHVISLRADYR